MFEQQGHESCKWSKTGEFYAVSDIILAEKKTASFIYFFIFEDGGWEEKDEFTVDKLLLPWSYE